MSGQRERPHRLQRRTIIVTGAALGIGLAVAQRPRAACAAVLMVDYDCDELEAAAKDVGAFAAQACVSRSEDVAAGAIDQTGRVGALVSNAGVLRDEVLRKLSDEDWETVLALHAGGASRFTRACVRISAPGSTGASSTSPRIRACAITGGR